MPSDWTMPSSWTMPRSWTMPSGWSMPRSRPRATRLRQVESCLKDTGMAGRVTLERVAPGYDLIPDLTSFPMLVKSLTN